MEEQFTDKEKTKFNKCNTFEEFVAFLQSFSINKMDNYGNTILHYYLKSLIYKSDRNGYEKNQPYKLNPELIINELVKNGIDINSQAKEGLRMNTPLSLSIGLGYKSKEIFNILIQLGADINQKIGHGNSVLSNAVMFYNNDKETNGYVIKRLIELGANAHSENNHGISAYSLATGIDNSEVSKYFTELE